MVHLNALPRLHWLPPLLCSLSFCLARWPTRLVWAARTQLSGGKRGRDLLHPRELLGVHFWCADDGQRCIQLLRNMHGERFHRGSFGEALEEKATSDGWLGPSTPSTATPYC